MKENTGKYEKVDYFLKKYLWVAQIIGTVKYKQTGFNTCMKIAEAENGNTKDGANFLFLTDEYLKNKVDGYELNDYNYFLIISQLEKEFEMNSCSSILHTIWHDMMHTNNDEFIEYMFLCAKIYICMYAHLDLISKRHIYHLSINTPIEGELVRKKVANSNVFSPCWDKDKLIDAYKDVKNCGFKLMDNTECVYIPEIDLFVIRNGFHHASIAQLLCSDYVETKYTIKIDDLQSDLEELNIFKKICKVYLRKRQS